MGMHIDELHELIALRAGFFQNQIFVPFVIFVIFVIFVDKIQFPKW